MKKIKGFVELALHLRYNIEIRARSSGSGVVQARLGPLLILAGYIYPKILIRKIGFLDGRGFPSLPHLRERAL